MGDVHARNRLNDLSNREWLRETKSFWLSREEAGSGEGGQVLGEFVEWLRASREPDDVERLLGQLDASFVYSVTPPRSKLKSLHPATFSEADVERLIRFFTKAGERVLDPFVGSGSTLIACASAGREGVGVELSEQWAEVARRRVSAEAAQGVLREGMSALLEVVVGDAKGALSGMGEGSFDFVVTSPPYWSILTKKGGLKVEAERVAQGLPTQYSEDAADLGNIEDYDEFLVALAEVFRECGRVLKAKRYMAVIVSDFRHGERFYLYHADLVAAIERVGLRLKGLTVLAQDNKNLYPYAIPYAFVSNIHHQYILVFQK